MFWENFRTVKMTMETGEREMELMKAGVSYDKQVCKILYLIVHDLLDTVRDNFLKSKQAMQSN